MITAKAAVAANEKEMTVNKDRTPNPISTARGYLSAARNELELLAFNTRVHVEILAALTSIRAAQSALGRVPDPDRQGRNNVVGEVAETDPRTEPAADASEVADGEREQSREGRSHR